MATIAEMEKQEQAEHARHILKDLPSLIHTWILPGSSGCLKAVNSQKETISYDFAQSTPPGATYGDIIYTGVQLVKNPTYRNIPYYYLSREAWENHVAATTKALGPVPAAPAVPTIPISPVIKVPMEEYSARHLSGFITDAIRPAIPTKANVAITNDPVNDILKAKNEKIDMLEEGVRSLKKKLENTTQPTASSPTFLAGRATATTQPLIGNVQEKIINIMVSEYNNFLRLYDLSYQAPELVQRVSFRSDECKPAIWKHFVNSCRAAGLPIKDSGLVIKIRGTWYPAEILINPTAYDALCQVRHDYDPHTVALIKALCNK